jgi:hypothetical protein
MGEGKDLRGHFVNSYDETESPVLGDFIRTTPIRAMSDWRTIEAAKNARPADE